ncbi:uncharacterized protein CPUR_06809 [Claviceps purpurea 20.1]|uniref:Uncharacterized protein n=1 Tax=Claviceps purpurea (strain 20.1) TaxID=1111077 RepID=M1WEC6_CLAP2|nr:uncharacterized protein CPUR_06809 [Claviceps purpurea 20.1]
MSLDAGVPVTCLIHSLISVRTLEGLPALPPPIVLEDISELMKKETGAEIARRDRHIPLKVETDVKK